ncbi:MAG: molybdenum cofactor guanylyltransferase [Bacteroidota bacterium]
MIYGLILTGGKSSRMGFEKYCINYHGLPQHLHLEKLLQQLNIAPYFSISSQQKQDFSSVKNTIIDQYDACGPIGGILSAMQCFPQASWLVLACDLPGIDTQHLHHLIDNQSEAYQVVTYQLHPDFYETTCTLYANNSINSLMDSLTNNKGSLQKALRQMKVRALKPLTETALTNINTPEGYDQYMKSLRK